MINSLKSFYKKTLRKEQGAIIVMTAVLFPLLLGFMGLSFDVGNLYIHKTRLQNIADAAALAGAREYIDSQKKTNGVKDKVNDSLNEGYVVTYVDGTEPDARHGMHPNADNGADYFIYKNAVNLHNTIKSDEYSHLALASTVSDDNRIFYRIGLNEQVRLYFLPVLLGGVNEKTVGAESIAVLEPGTKTVNTIAGAQKYSIFENLFTYSGYFATGISNEITANGNQGDKYSGIFIGKLAYTYGNGSGAFDSGNNSFYNIDELIAGGYYPHLLSEFSNFNPNKKPNNQNNKQWEIVNDPTISTISSTEAYIDAFKDRLEKPHLVIQGNNKDFTLTYEGNIDFDNLKTNDGQNTNVIYVDDTNTGELTISLNSKITPVADKSPIYVIIHENVKLKAINSTVSDDTNVVKNGTVSGHTFGRPLIIVYFGTSSFELNIGSDQSGRCVLDGVVYAPKASAVTAYLNGSFYGNIVAPGINLNFKSQSQSVFSQTNFLESNDYTDDYVKAVTNQIALYAQSNLPPQSVIDSVIGEYLNVLGISLKDYNKLSKENKNIFYKGLSYEQKMAIYAKWLELRQDPNYAAYKDFLWPFGNEDLFEPESSSSSGNSYTTTDYSVGTLRLINPRTEYTMDNPFNSL